MNLLEELRPYLSATKDGELVYLLPYRYDAETDDVEHAEVAITMHGTTPASISATIYSSDELWLCVSLRRDLERTLAEHTVDYLVKRAYQVEKQQERERVEAQEYHQEMRIRRAQFANWGL